MSLKNLTAIIVAGFLLLLFLVFLIFGSTVSGVVVSSDKGEPIPFAAVSVDGVSTLCNENGEFTRWVSPFSKRIITADHPCFDRFSSYLTGFDLSKPIEIKLNNSSFETMIAVCQEQLYAKTHYVLKNSTISYSHFEDSDSIAKKIETAFVVTPEAQLFSQDSSNSFDGPLDSGHTTIVVGSDPENIGSMLYKNHVPQVYYKGDTTDWITFKSSEDLDFEVAILGNSNPKRFLEPLYSYGNTTQYEQVLLTDSKNPDDLLVGVKTSWDPEGPLKGKSVLFLFSKTGEWYDIVFEDTGENPISEQGKYHFTCIDYGNHVDIEIPADAKKMTPRELVDSQNKEGN